jgi:hypothetical protein
MNQFDGEKRIKALQKEFLMWLEDHPALRTMAADDFDALRRSVFRGTFQAFRLGIIGLEESDISLRKYFFTWLETTPLGPSTETHIAMECFRVSLEAFRVGALVAGAKKREADEIFFR